MKCKEDYSMKKRNINMIRKLTKEDIPEYQHLITTVWNETYPGIINDKFLKSLYQGEQVRIELDLYTFNEETNQILVIEENNKLVGFTRYGKSSDKLYPNTGEIFSLYVLKEYHHKGHVEKSCIKVRTI